MCTVCHSGGLSVRVRGKRNGKGTDFIQWCAKAQKGQWKGTLEGTVIFSPLEESINLKSLALKMKMIIMIKQCGKIWKVTQLHVAS